MSQTAQDSGSFSPDDVLPPVEPPSAGFILKLFVVPALIVMVVLAVVFSIYYLAHMDSDPYKSLAALEGGRANAWLEANNVADEIRGNPQLRRDPKLAAGIGAALIERIKEPIPAGDDEAAFNEIKLRFFLCKALGEMEVDRGMPALVKAAQPERTDNEIDVRCAAIESIGLLTHTLRQAGNEPDLSQALPAVLQASRDRSTDDDWRRDLVRSRAAYTLGILESPEATQRLHEMLGDGYADARFNAATSLARHGDPQCIEVLVEMIDPAYGAGAAEEKEESARAYKKALVHVNGLRAAEQLAAANPQADMQPIITAIENLLQTDGLPSGVKTRARGVLQVLKSKS